MSTQYYYHGTSADNLDSILIHGLSCNEEKLWNASRDEIYLWCPESLAIANRNEDYSEEDKEREAFRYAFENAQIACSKSKDCRAVVLKVKLNPKNVFKDNSCPNMEGAVCITQDIPVSNIMSIQISSDLSLIRGHFINIMRNMEYSALSFSAMELKVADLFNKLELYPEDIEDTIEWFEINKTICNAP